MVVSCCLEAGVMEYWSIGPDVEYIRFFSSNTPSLQYSSTPVRKKHTRQIKPDGLFNQQS